MLEDRRDPSVLQVDDRIAHALGFVYDMIWDKIPKSVSKVNIEGTGAIFLGVLGDNRLAEGALMLALIVLLPICAKCVWSFLSI